MLSYSKSNKSGKDYYFISLNNIGLGDNDEMIASLFGTTPEDYIAILIASGGYQVDNRGYIFDNIESVETAIVMLKMLLEEVG
jgi:hypothetical protein